MAHGSSGFGTKAIHAGNLRDKQYGSLTMPIYQTSTFFFENCEQGGHRFAGQENGYIYTRLGNPTTSVLESKVAALENGEACVAASSGMGAISSCLWSIAGAGKHILADETLYGCTFAYLQRPLELGADVVVHSATKYLNGHGDVIAGFVIGKADFMQEVRMFGLKDMTGAVLGPFESFLILRGLKTLEIRMQRHCASAKAIAEFLDGHEKVEKVYFPGLVNHLGHEIAKKQMDDFGGMISFEVKGGKEAGMKFVNSLSLATIAVSLGDAETLIEHPASMTHSTYGEEDLKAAGISAGLIRLSVGLENVEDIIEDLRMGLEKI